MEKIIGIIASDRRIKTMEDLEEYSKLENKYQLGNWKIKKGAQNERKQ